MRSCSEISESRQWLMPIDRLAIDKDLVVLWITEPASEIINRVRTGCWHHSYALTSGVNDVKAWGLRWFHIQTVGDTKPHREGNAGISFRKPKTSPDQAL